MFQRIVVPLDGSELSERALPQAEELARRTGVPIHILRVVDLGKVMGQGAWTFGAAPAALQQAVDEEERIAREYVARTEQVLSGGGLTASGELRHGVAEREIVAATCRDDLVVMATHGRGGLPRWYLGSVAEEVARRSPVPVMLVRVTSAAEAINGHHAAGIAPAPRGTAPARKGA